MKEYKITINNKTRLVVVKKIQSNNAIVEVDGTQYNVEIESKIKRHLEPLDVKPNPPTTFASNSIDKKRIESSPSSEAQIVAPLPGMIMQILVKEGDKISANQIVMKMEAMKMENDIKSDKDGIIEKIHVNQGEAILENTVLISLGKI
jgi:biotin carboxyl carrier protein